VVIFGLENSSHFKEAVFDEIGFLSTKILIIPFLFDYPKPTLIFIAFRVESI